MVVPDAAVWLRAYARGDDAFFRTVRQEWSHWNWAALGECCAAAPVAAYASNLRLCFHLRRHHLPMPMPMPMRKGMWTREKWGGGMHVSMGRRAMCLCLNSLLTDTSLSFRLIPSD